MKIAYILYDGITYLDFIGIYDPLSRLKMMHYIPDLTWDICANKTQIKDSFGLTTLCDKVLNDLSGYDMIIIPGGFGTRQLTMDNDYISWLKTAENVPYILRIRDKVKNGRNKYQYFNKKHAPCAEQGRVRFSQYS
jgi:putative intracellular protease/amidase